ncbi:HINT domain-containing protein [Terrisporobacter petrolearius]|nr:HINT domain-containing protein [Terrisporobacter petrolearius]
MDKVVHNELIRVYNFEVEDFHTYFVSDASVLVHNNYSGVRRKKVFYKVKIYQRKAR